MINLKEDTVALTQLNEGSLRPYSPPVIYLLTEVEPAGSNSTHVVEGTLGGLGSGS
jgi:hypothetical protein